MANTWTAYYLGVAFAATKNMAAVLNGNAGGRVIRIKRVGLINAQTAAVSGVVCSTELRRYTGATLSGNTAVTPVAHDTNNSALATITTGHAGTIVGTPSTLRRWIWSSDEAKVTTAQNNEWETLVPLNIVYDSYGDTTVQPLALRGTAEEIMVYNVSGAAGLLDTWIEFLDEAS